MVRMAFEFFFKLFENLLPMLSLPFGLTGIVAEDIPAPDFPSPRTTSFAWRFSAIVSKPAAPGKYLFLDL